MIDQIGSQEITLLVLAIVTAIFSLGMLFFKNPISVALCLLAVLLGSGAIYAVIGEHLVATFQIVVYAGAIMVLFVFSIMLLNLNVELKNDLKDKISFLPGYFQLKNFIGLLFFILLFSILGKTLYDFSLASESQYQWGSFYNTTEKSISTTVQLSMELFSNYYVGFELVGIALLIATVGAVVLAKRHFD